MQFVLIIWFIELTDNKNATFIFKEHEVNIPMGSDDNSFFLALFCAGLRRSVL